MTLEAQITALAQNIGRDIKDIKSVMQITKNGNQSLTGTAYQDIINFDTPEINNLTAMTFNKALGTFTCREAGIYAFHFNTTLDQVGENHRGSAATQMVINNVLLKGTRQIGYHREEDNGFNNYSCNRFVELAMGDVVKFQARNLSKIQQVLADATSIIVKRI